MKNNSKVARNEPQNAVAEEPERQQLNARVPRAMKSAIARVAKDSGVNLELLVEDALRWYYGCETQEGAMRRPFLLQFGTRAFREAGLPIREEKLEREKGFEPSTFTLARCIAVDFRTAGDQSRMVVNGLDVAGNSDVPSIRVLPAVPATVVACDFAGSASASPRQRIARAA